jgi:hypothetical protein
MKTLAALILAVIPLAAGPLRVGWAHVDVTPERPVAIGGQVHTRISKFVKDPVTVTALALEGSDGSATSAAILISQDGPGREGLLGPLRSEVERRLPGFDPRNLTVIATHTHTAPETDEGMYEIPDDPKIMRPAEYRVFLIARMAEAAVTAWNARQPTGMSYGLGFAVAGRNRRVAYMNGRSEMYGNTAREDFDHIEGYEDHSVHSIFFRSGGKLTGIAVALACPSQQVENEEYVSADFWADVRRDLRRKYGPDVHVLAMSTAAGDQSPRTMYQGKAERRMRDKRGINETAELARRIVNAVNETYDAVSGDVATGVTFRHRVEVLQLPRRLVTEAENEKALKESERLATSKDPGRSFFRYFHKQTAERYIQQRTNPHYPAEVHVLRLGDLAIATNPFELFTDFGVAIEAQSPAIQTLIVQLAGGYAGYLPTARALAGGSYSTFVESNQVGPEGGRLLVSRTVQLLSSLWQ